ncbi:phytanoyl-CoA dioxygenase [Paeniroseomonas aquatica]|uniref:Phytanoyl-CoA dioxygenase n=1 Tax=Paeniroseomonas aquatica TaxID=373043 RepID=A0ABT8AF23_9PROT|nr:phytanoyl-CoA dioxygenase [Paeniroseomonas aquatica]MDN3567944.1 phytanoyl-CoA dioxygenase [Paeniroseomonas aquatica]
MPMPAWSRWLLLPLQVLAVATGAKSFRDNPVLGHARLNRWGLHLWRKRLALRLAAARRRRLAPGIAAADRAAFERDGYLAIPDFLPPAEFARVRAELLGWTTPAREFVDGSTLTRLIPLDGTALPGLPATAAALGGARYRGLHDYVGSCRLPPHLFVQTVFSGVREAPPDVQSHFHSDTFHPTVKSWLFLTEVPGDAAGFTYVPGSHRPGRRHLAWERRVSVTAAQHADRLTGEGSLRIEEAMLRRLGYPAPRKLAVAANTLVIADTSGFHRRGISAGSACRIAIWGYARGWPFQPWAGIGRGLRSGRVVRGFWAAQDLLARLGGRGNGWGWVGDRSPAAPPRLPGEAPGPAQ